MTVATAIDLVELPLLDPAGCAAVRAELDAVQSHWTRRHPLAPFFTLGAASYLDASTPGRYATLAADANPVLASRFGFLFDQVAEALAKHLGAPCVATTEHALPGFHVFGDHPAFEKPLALVHVDLPHHALDWGGDDPATLPTVTYTLPISLPAAGAGLDAWEVGAEEWLATAPEARVPLLRTRARRHVAYAAGRLVVHSGAFAHRIAPAAAIMPGDARITYHGHGVFRRGAWHLYW